MAPKSMYYTLDEHYEPIPCDTLTEYRQWRAGFPEPNRMTLQVALDYVHQYRISTIFLAIDHGMLWDTDAAPILWETMIFCDDEPAKDYFSEPQWRYTNHWLALETHQEIVQQLMMGVSPNQVLTNVHELN